MEMKRPFGCNNYRSICVCLPNKTKIANLGYFVVIFKCIDLLSNNHYQQTWIKKLKHFACGTIFLVFIVSNDGLPMKLHNYIEMFTIFFVSLCHL